MKVQRYFMGFVSHFAKYIDLSFVVCFVFLQTVATTALVAQSEAYDPNITFIDEHTSESSFRILADASTLVGENTYGESFMLAKHPDGYFTGDHLPIFPIPSGFLVRLTATSETGIVRRTEFFRYLEENPT
ncbi:hypothetical protein [Pseudobacteriovorax antillogorgiicola]|uniref:Uncharacterized protein n=1 Tax=Pseudobacteriovorax antillogorgiicola TaxID=1513793 RepID=A0A1Y6BLY1_9BACT|nr:hypothetical protein [Pseudobacteriovorax antillogorgiicola]TCS55593.1 hypothetical protein EDD56_105319 [Pseudobacteriovorax antillogorgiicola]SMF10494.1 hypothetical protein SAMN06296036_1055 [Pseudobacteriovorax antillogorgiicola]